MLNRKSGGNISSKNVIKEPLKAPSENTQITVTKTIEEGTIHLEMENSCKEIVDLNFMVETLMDLNEDSFAEILNSVGYHFIKLVKMDHSRFIFTFFEKEDMDSMEWENLKIWIRSSKSILSDFVYPRLTWITISGLPFAALAEDVINKVVGSIGNVLSKELNNTKKKATNPPYFCISTIHFEKIQQTRVVNIDNQQFEILIQELENNTHKSSPANVQEEPNPTPPSSFSMETNAFPDDEATHVDKVYEVNSVACSSTSHQHSDS